MGRNSSLLTSGLVCMYMWSLNFSGMTYGTKEECNELMDSKNTYLVKLIFGLLCFIATITNNFFGDDLTNLEQGHKKTENNEIINELDQNEESYTNHKWLTFHGIMVIGGCAYLIMIVSNWAAVDYSYYTFGDDSNQNDISLWVH